MTTAKNKPWEGGEPSIAREPDAPEARGPGNPQWKQGMRSPNPKGRPRGIVDKRQRLNKMLADDADKIVQVIVASALEGDMQAANLILSRIAPALKAQAERVQFEFDAEAAMVAQVQAVLQGIADGNVSACIGKEIIDSIATLDSVREMQTIKARLEALEGGP